MTVASSGLYREAIRDYNDWFPSEPFELLPLALGTTIRLRKLKASLSQVKNLAHDDVLRLLLLNRIPVDWVDHTYTFGMVYMDYHYSASDTMRDSFTITYLRARGPQEVENNPPPSVHLTRMFYTPGKTPKSSQPALQQVPASGPVSSRSVTGMNKSLATQTALGASAGASSQTRSSRPLESGPLPVSDMEIEMAEASALSPPSAVNTAIQSNMDWEHQQGHNSDGSRRSTGRRRSM
ncbi:hypothetical protein H0H92_004275 [Tricholoma furcatifolium]|nr:hypothetical protein H0H92_004275 [Tricholoma furcatifolium]